MKKPNWAKVEFDDIDFQDIYYYSSPKGFEDKPKRGLRIDQIWATQTLNKSTIEVGIDYQIRGMEKPSDHAPIWTVFDI